MVPPMSSSFPEKDPYAVLGVSVTATDAEISKAYRQLARTVHPDKYNQQKGSSKQQNNNNDTKQVEKEIEVMKKRFHEIQVARSFLLDTEFAKVRKQYDDKRAAEKKISTANAIREQNMSESRKRMKDILNQQEKLAHKSNKKRSYHHNDDDNELHRTDKKNRTKSQSSSSTRTKTSTFNDDTVMDRLRKQGQKLREQYADRMEDYNNDIDLDERNTTTSSLPETGAKFKIYSQPQSSTSIQLQKRQVRIKFSRKRIKEYIQQDEINIMDDMPDNNDSDSRLIDALTQLIQKDVVGCRITNIEIIGRKGNVGIVTLSEIATTYQVVDYYETSKILRASFITDGDDDDEDNDFISRSNYIGNNNNDSSSIDRKARREIEREMLARKMMMEENDDLDNSTMNDDPNGKRQDEYSTNNINDNKNQSSFNLSDYSKFPPKLPGYDDDESKINDNESSFSTYQSPYQILLQLEKEILGTIFVDEPLSE